MQVIHARNVNEALPLGLHVVKQHGIPVVSRGLDTLEVPGPVATVYQKPWENVLMCPTRDANPFFHFFESMWILAGADTVALPKFFLGRITDYSDDGKRFHGAYGARLRNWDGLDQLMEVVELLRAKPDTRQAVMSIWNPAYDLGTVSKDIPCNDMVMFKIRDGRLNMTVCNRSNDVIWGAYGANAVQFSILQEVVAALVEVRVGTYTQVSDSYHVYTDLPLWQQYARGQYRPWGHVVNPYEHALVVPLLAGPRTGALEFLEDCALLNRAAEEGVLHRMAQPRVMKSVVGALVALPMLVAYLNYKNRDYHGALAATDRIARADWREACRWWVQRRMNKAGENNDSV